MTDPRWTEDLDSVFVIDMSKSADTEDDEAYLLERDSCGCREKDGAGSTPAKPSERITGSERNPEGSASGSRGGIEISQRTEDALREKVKEHNEKHGDDDGKKVDLGMLKAVYRRGAGAFSTSHRPGIGRDQWAMARVNAFLALVRRGRPEDADYVTDNDLLPKQHPKRSEKSCCDHDDRIVSQKAMWSRVIVKAGRRDADREDGEIKEEEDEFSKKVSVVFDAQVKAVLEEVSAASAIDPSLLAKVERLLRSKSWNDALVDAFRPFLEQAIVTGLGIGHDTLVQIARRPVNFNPSNEALSEYAKKESVRLATATASAVNQYTSVRISEILKDGLAQGETISQLTERVRDWAAAKGDAERATRTRARTVARTEAMRAARVAEVEAWRFSGVVVGKTWLLAPDPCEFCEAAAEQFSERAVALDAPFYAKGEVLKGADDGEMLMDYEDVQGPPLHPNCRCSMQPRLDDEFEKLLEEGRRRNEQDAQRQVREAAMADRNRQANDELEASIMEDE